MTRYDNDLEGLLGRYLRDEDEDAMAELVRRTRGKLLAAARRIGRPQDAEDSVQAAYHSLVRRGELPDGVPVEGWLMTATVRIAFRRKAVDARDLDLARRLAAGAGAPGHTPSAMQTASLAQSLSLVRAAVHRLPAGYREPVVLYHLQQLSVDETAALMGIPPSTVATRLQRARAMLRSRLSPTLLYPLLVLPWWFLDGARGAGVGAAKATGATLAAAAAVTAVVVAVASSTPDAPAAEAAATAKVAPPAATVLVAEPPARAPARAPASVPASVPRPASEPAPDLRPRPEVPVLADARVPRPAPTLPPPRALPEPQPSEPPATAPAKPATPRIPYTGYLEEPLPLADGSTSRTIAQSQVDALHQALLRDPETGFLALLDAGLAQWAGRTGYRATLYKKERRNGVTQPEEVIDVRFHRPYCLRMVWLDRNNKDQKLLFVRGQYGDKLNLQVKKLFLRIRLQKHPTDPAVLATTNHPITAASFGQMLARKRALTEAALEGQGVTLEYGGIVERGQFRVPAFMVTRHFDWPGTPLRKCVDWIDARTLMPLGTEAWDDEGFLESYRSRSIRLDPMVGTRPELNAPDFYRSNVFPEDADWGEERENWEFTDLK